MGSFLCMAYGPDSLCKEVKDMILWFYQFYSLTCETINWFPGFLYLLFSC